MNKNTVQIIIIGIVALLVLGIVVTVGFVMSNSTGSDTSVDESTTLATPDGTTDASTTDSTTASPDDVTTTPSDVTTSPDSSTTEEPTTTTAPNETEPAVETTTQITDYPTLSGRFISKNESYLKLVVDWKTLKRTETSADIEFKVILSHYSLFVGPRNASTFKVGDNVFQFNTANIDQAEVKKTETLFAIYKVTLPLNDGKGEFDLSSSWVFNGTYGGHELGTLVIDEKLVIE